MVGARGFEPPTTATPLRCATRLRYAPKVVNCKALSFKKLGDLLQFINKRAGKKPFSRPVRIQTSHLELIAGATDRVALDVKKFTNCPNELYFVTLIISTVSTTFNWLELRKLLLPVAKYVRLYGA